MGRIVVHEEGYPNTRLRFINRCECKQFCVQVFMREIWQNFLDSQRLETLLLIVEDKSRQWVENGLRKGATNAMERFESVVTRYNERGIGGKLDFLSTILNTAYRGNDTNKLMARLEGQCELHCYIEGRNREWLASRLPVGGYFQELLPLLRRSNKQPLVFSYSVCNPFPNPLTAQGINEADDYGYEQLASLYNHWDNLNTSRQWELGLMGLRSQGGGLEISPEQWSEDDFYFMYGWTAQKLNWLISEVVTLPLGDRYSAMSKIINVSLGENDDKSTK